MAEIIATVFADGPSALAAARRAAIAGADWIELRFDRWPLERDPAELIGKIALPVIATCRVDRDGGAFAGTLADRRTLLQRALAGGARGIDLEDWEDWVPAPRPSLVIRSHHNLTGVGRDLPALRDRLLAMGADVAKLAVTAPDLADAAPVLELLAGTDQGSEPTVAFAMGRAAAATRVLSCALGAPYAYASASDDGAGVGQLPIDLMRGVYGAHRLGTGTALFGLLGNPANHSLGPWLHNRVFRALGRDAVYVPFETARPDQVLAMLPRRRLRAFSVTAPYKELMAQACHALDAAAAATGVVNTVLFDAHGQVRGCNTDVVGVQAALASAGLRCAPEAGTTAVVLGAGGAARAAVVVLAEMGFAVTILARTLEPIRAFAKAQRAQVGALRGDVLRGLAPHVVVNATPIGQVGSPTAGERPVPDWQPTARMFVFDMVYRPAITPLLVAAEAAGAVPISGLEMFLAQAQEQVRLFTGETVAHERLRGFLAGVL